MAEEMKTERITTMMTPSEVKLIDDWAFANRIRSRGEAIRRLIEAGLNTTDKLSAVSPGGSGSGGSPKPQRQSIATEKPTTRKAPRAKPAAMSKEAQFRALRERSG